MSYVQQVSGSLLRSSTINRDLGTHFEMEMLGLFYCINPSLGAQQLGLIVNDNKRILLPAARMDR